MRLIYNLLLIDERYDIKVLRRDQLTARKRDARSWSRAEHHARIELEASKQIERASREYGSLFVNQAMWYA